MFVGKERKWEMMKTTASDPGSNPKKGGGDVETTTAGRNVSRQKVQKRAGGGTKEEVRPFFKGPTNVRWKTKQSC